MVHPKYIVCFFQLPVSFRSSTTHFSCLSNCVNQTFSQLYIHATRETKFAAITGSIAKQVATPGYCLSQSYKAAQLTAAM